jgi:hypothetical protein
MLANARNLKSICHVFWRRPFRSARRGEHACNVMYAHACIVYTVLARVLLLRLRQLGWLLWPFLFTYTNLSRWAAIALSVFYSRCIKRSPILFTAVETLWMSAKMEKGPFTATSSSHLGAVIRNVRFFIAISVFFI